MFNRTVYDFLCELTDKHLIFPDFPFHVTVVVDKALKRKRQACCYCGELTQKLPRHMTRHHPKEEEVAVALSYPSGSTERKAAWHKLRSRGNYHHNMTVMDVGEGDFIVARKPNQSLARDVTVKDFLPCPHCRGFYRKQELWKHTTSCKLKSDEKSEMQKHIQVSSKLILLGGLKGSNDMLNNVLATMRSDEVSEVAKSDEIILGVGKLLVEKHGIAKAQDTTQTIRELSRLLIELRKTEHNPQAHLLSFIVPTMFDQVVEAVKTLCAFEVKNGKQDVGTPSLALKIGYGLKKCVNVVIGKALRDEDHVTERAADNFRRLLETEWSHRVSHHSLTTLSTRKFNKVNVLPLAEDLEKLRQYIDKNMSLAMESLKKNPNLDDWSLLAKATLTRLVMFNKRRVGETSKLPLDTYINRPDWSVVNSNEVTKSLNRFEQELSKR